MLPTTQICQVRVRDTSPGSTLVPLPQKPDIDPALRLKWSEAIMKAYHDGANLKDPSRIRGWDLILNHDGTVENICDPSDSLEPASTAKIECPTARYPAPYQVPDLVIRTFDHAEKVRRTELFAVGSLLYEIASSTKPFHEEADEMVQSLFATGNFPEDVWEMPCAMSILCCWCPEIVGIMHNEEQGERNRPFFNRLGHYARTHPIIFSSQVLGGVVSVASLAALPVLGVIGFSTVGPAAGSLAAGWQSSIGLVQAGSLFAWCQSAAMGGAAVTGIVLGGVSGATVVAGTAALQALHPDSKTVPGRLLKPYFITAWNEVINRGEKLDSKI